MKKMLSAVLACAVLAGMLAGCGGPAVSEAGTVMETGESLDGLLDEQRKEAEASAPQDQAGQGDGTSQAPVEPSARPDGPEDTDAARPNDADQDEAAAKPAVVAPLVEGNYDRNGQPTEAAYVAPPMPEEMGPVGDSAVSEPVGEPVASEPDPVEMPAGASEDIGEEMVAMSASTYQTYLPVASLTSVQASNSYGWLDYGNAADGYVVVCYTAPTSMRLKCLVKGPSGTQYTYNLQQGAVTTLPLSDGSGQYTVGLYENVTGSKYAKNLSQSFQVSLKNEFGPFLYSNQYVDYMPAANTRATGADLCSRAPDLLGKVDQVYSWVVANLTYDYDKARSVQSGYLPVLDDVLASRKGICFDYAALMAGMLRSQGIPCKLVVGYAGTAYHAWISVWSDEAGWIEGVIYFDGTTWQRMDPTFASSGGQSDSIMQYIGNGANYKAKYLY